ncbi:glycosyltransferase family 39 protein [Thermodesulfobacteriota bacterium]
MYGGFFDSTTQAISFLVVLLTNDYLFESRHFINAVYGFIGIIGVYKLGSLLTDRMGGFFSALFLILTPRYYGHMFNNPKDIPFAVLYLFSIYYMLLFYKQLPYCTKKNTLKLGLIIGLTLGLRVGGIVLYCYLFLLIAVWFIAHRSSLQNFGDLKKNLINLIGSISLIGFLSWLTMLFFWPWAQKSPLLNPLHAFSTISKYPWKGIMLYKGEFITADTIPWNYLLTWFSITLPEHYFLCLGVGALLLLKITKDIFKVRNKERIIFITFLLFSSLFPVTYVILKHSPLYDGIRHFLFVIPILAVLCGTILSLFWSSDTNHLWKKSMIILLCLPFGITAYDMVKLHPYQTIYFNRLIGKARYEAYENFDTDYWGNSYKEGAEWLKDHSKNRNMEIIDVSPSYPFPLDIIYYYLCRNEANLAGKLYAQKIFHMHYQQNLSTILKKDESNVKFRVTSIRDSKYPDYILATTRANDFQNVKGKIEHVVTRNGIPLLYIFDTRPE